MAERTEELKREIDDTRENLGATLDAIGDRVSPGRIAERRVNRVRQSTNRLRDKVMGATDTTKTHIGQGYGNVSGTLGDTSGSVKDSIAGTAGSVTDTVKSAPDSLMQQTQGNPLLAGALAFGVGAFVASLLPTTEAEQSVAGSVAQPLKSQLSEIGSEIADTAKETAQDAMESTKQVVADAKDEVTQEAAGAAQQVKSEAASAKDQVADTAKSGDSPLGS